MISFNNILFKHMRYTLIFLRNNRIIISKKDYQDWMKIADDYQDYMSSFFIEDDNLLEYLISEYRLNESVVGRIETFMSDSKKTAFSMDMSGFLNESDQ